ncbi:hypothetical protein K437DRAFT_254956 [Tilletiaria anomala UBC 951]|uniref:Uncharacterized protein n=1 Tax=Tilletiaria anomala (strain ATCC 24038 / CBS 436.72 / UBC 951) TaxID=1037660 RepID=A0A066WK28_TILAU|nr:uncharacterized protein K437DRAFT_254956 [Tilletiaria anomala UBC 951]KDN51359.1 hypothetical protein K437DRAFT_254956 [Tilletiaria anomala UBC 951]
MSRTTRLFLRQPSALCLGHAEFNTAKLRAQMLWPARVVRTAPPSIPLSNSLCTQTRSSLCRMQYNVTVGPVGLQARSTASVLLSVRLAHTVPRTLQQRSQNSGTQEVSTEVSQPIIIYRGGAAFKPWLSIFSALVFLFAGITIAPMIVDGLSYPNFGITGWERDEDGNIKEAELLPRTARGIAAGAFVMLGAASGWFFVMVPIRTITRMTIHPASREIAIRTTLASPLAYLPLGARRAARLGLKHPLATKNGSPDGPRDRRTRVLPLDSVYRQIRQSDVQDFGAANLSSSARSALALVLPASAAAGTLDQGKRLRKSANTTDQLYLDIKPFKLLFGIRASGGKDVAELEEPPSTESHGRDGTVVAARKGRSLYAVGWDNFKYWLLQSTDWEDLPAAQAKELRRAGDPWLRSKCQEAAKRRAKSSQAFVSTVIGDGLGKKEPWFRDRANFDALFPESKL